MSDPITDLQYGKPDWADFVNNWREKDAEWLRDRSIMRFATTASRDTAVSGASPGTFVYRADAESGAGGWEAKRQTGGFFSFRPLPVNLATSVDTTSSVVLAHGLASGKGINFTPTTVLVNADNFNLHAGVLTSDATGINIKTGTKTAKLTTNTTSLLVDSPLSVPSIALTGAGTVLTAPAKTVAVGTLTADVGTITNITMSGTLTGGILNGTRALINGVNIGWDPGLTVPAAWANGLSASAGLLSQAGYFYGDGSSAIMRQRTPTTGALSAQYIQVQAADIIIGPTNAPGSVFHYPYLRIMQGRGVPWHNAAGTHVAWIAPTIYSGSDPGAANYPDGTIWVS